MSRRLDRAKRTGRSAPALARRLRTLLAAGLIMVPLLVHADDLQEGVHYQRVGDPPAEPPAQVEVIEYFSYACPFCAQFHPLIDDWVEQRSDAVELKHVPLAFRDDWEPLARAYYVAAEQDAVDGMHGPLFRALHEQGRNLDSRDALLDFLADHGVDRDAAADGWEGFGVERALSRDTRLAERHGIDATPSIVIAGAYRVTPRTAGSLEAMIDIADQLVDRHARGGG